MKNLKKDYLCCFFTVHDNIQLIKLIVFVQMLDKLIFSFDKEIGLITL